MRSPVHAIKKYFTTVQRNGGSPNVDLKLCVGFLNQLQKIRKKKGQGAPLILPEVGNLPDFERAAILVKQEKMRPASLPSILRRFPSDDLVSAEELDKDRANLPDVIARHISDFEELVYDERKRL